MRGLKIALVVFGILNIVCGAAFIIAPYQLASMYGFGEIGGYMLYLMSGLGVSFIAPSVWLILASRDPIRNITWVKFAILWCVLSVVVSLYSIAQGSVSFSQAGFGIILDGVFAIAFFAFYPYRGR